MMRLRLWIRTAAAVLVTGGLLAAAGCGQAYKVGDCVKIKQKTIDSELTSTGCSSGSSLGDPTYKVDEVHDGAGGACAPTGFGSVTFSDEPADKTYCLSFAN